MLTQVQPQRVLSLHPPPQVGNTLLKSLTRVIHMLHLTSWAVVPGVSREKLEVPSHLTNCMQRVGTIMGRWTMALLPWKLQNPYPSYCYYVCYSITDPSTFPLFPPLTWENRYLEVSTLLSLVSKRERSSALLELAELNHVHPLPAQDHCCFDAPAKENLCRFFLSSEWSFPLLALGDTEHPGWARALYGYF